MKYNINDLYFAKCRHCIMDIFMSYYEGDKEIVPRPDYVDYYTILLFRNGKYINIFDKNRKYVGDNGCYEHYDEDIILEMHDLEEFVFENYKMLSHKECRLVQSTIEKTKCLKLEYGYKKD